MHADAGAHGPGVRRRLFDGRTKGRGGGADHRPREGLQGPARPGGHPAGARRRLPPRRGRPICWHPLLLVITQCGSSGQQQHPLAGALNASSAVPVPPLRAASSSAQGAGPSAGRCSAGGVWYARAATPRPPCSRCAPWTRASTTRAAEGTAEGHPWCSPTRGQDPTTSAHSPSPSEHAPLAPPPHAATHLPHCGPGTELGACLGRSWGVPEDGVGACLGTGVGLRAWGRELGACLRDGVWGVPGDGVGGVPSRVLGRPRRSGRASGTEPGRAWDGVGACLGQSWQVLGQSWGVPGTRSWGVPGCRVSPGTELGACLGRLTRGVPGRSWGVPGTVGNPQTESGECLGQSWGVPGTELGMPGTE